MTKQTNNTNIIGVKEFRQNLDKYARAVAKGQSFTVLRRSKPIFSLRAPVTYDEWGDESGIWKNGVDLRDDEGNGMPIEEFLVQLKKAQKHDGQSSKISK